MSDFVVDVELLKESGLYKMKLNDDCRIVELSIVESIDEDVKMYSGDDYTFCVGEEYEYYNVEVK